MKIVVIGDLHGNNSWQRIIKQEPDYDLVVFIGDYWDSYDYTFLQQAKNFEQLCKFKQANKDKVVLLLGNHDLEYLPVFQEHYQFYTGYQEEYAFLIQELLLANLPLMQMALNYKNYLFTHAGVTITWLKNNEYLFNNYPIDVFINNRFKYKPLSFIFTGSNAYGDDVTQSPIWVRPRSLMRDSKPLGYVQIVGHTSQTKIDIKGKSTGGKYYFIDVLNSNNEYLIIQDGEFISKKIKE